MGQASSRVVHARSPRKGIIISFDALGTLYTFKKPVAQQYLQVAQRCGLRTQLSADDIKEAFKISFKSHSTQYPNYGKGKLESPQIWWQNLTADVFRQVTDEVPQGLDSALYRHFASGDAYELYPDVRPFLDGIRTLREQNAHAHGPSLIVGVISNSDPRTRDVLQSLSLTVGNASHSKLREAATFSQISNRSAEFRAPWAGAYDAARDIDFLSTSYDSGYEKPHGGAFRDAEQQAAIVMLGKTTQDLDYSLGMAGLKTAFQSISLLNRGIDDVRGMQWIHIGDEMVKDIEGAMEYGFEALLIDRECKHEMAKRRVTSLKEVAGIVNVLAQEGFEQ